MAQLCQMAAAMASSRWVAWVIRASEDLLARHGVSASPGGQVVDRLIGQAVRRIRVSADLKTGPGQIWAANVAVESA